MPRTVRSLALAAILVAFAFASSPASAQEKIDGTKAKAAAVENLTKIKIDKPTIVETDNFVVAGSMPAEKAKALGAFLEKSLKVARTAAKFDEKEAAWKGKLVVYFLPDGDEYKAFMRRVLQTPPEGTHVNLRSDPALIVDPVDVPGKPTDADLYANTASRIMGELLRAKGTGTQMVPEWLRDSFGRVAVMHAEGKTKRYLAYRTAARNAVVKGGKAISIADAMTGDKTATGEALANSLAEFLAFNRGVDFGKFLDALRPTEENQNPTVQTGFLALGWKDQAMAEAAWKRWVQTGK